MLLYGIPKLLFFEFARILIVGKVETNIDSAGRWLRYYKGFAYGVFLVGKLFRELGLDLR